MPLMAPPPAAATGARSQSAEPLIMFRKPRRASGEWGRAAGRAWGPAAGWRTQCRHAVPLTIRKCFAPTPASHMPQTSHLRRLKRQQLARGPAVGVWEFPPRPTFQEEGNRPRAPGGACVAAGAVQGAVAVVRALGVHVDACLEQSREGVQRCMKGCHLQQRALLQVLGLGVEPEVVGVQAERRGEALIAEGLQVVGCDRGSNGGGQQRRPRHRSRSNFEKGSVGARGATA